MSRTLNDDFDEDDLPAGNLDLEKGTAQVGTGIPSNYGGDGIDFDDELYGNDEGPGGSLELDVPDLALPPPRSSGSLPAARSSGQQQAVRAPAAPPPPAPQSDGHNGFAPPPASSSNVSRGMPASPESSGKLPAHGDRHGNGPEDAAEPAPQPLSAKPTPAALIAKYPTAPASITHAPMYAIRVVRRQLELRTDLESLRRRRSPDVPLYEAALKAYDVKTFRLGMAINCAALAVATFIFFLPVIFRFMAD